LIKPQRSFLYAIVLRQRSRGKQEPADDFVAAIEASLSHFLSLGTCAAHTSGNNHGISCGRRERNNAAFYCKEWSVRDFSADPGKVLVRSFAHQ
jgi:hypothetical protein